MNRLVDIGVNLTHNSLQHQLEAVLQRAHHAGVDQLVVTGTSEQESRAAVTLCEKYPSQLFSTCGVHPHHASEWNENSYGNLQTLAANNCVRAIGETGLDFNRNYSSPEDQQHAFERQLQLAAELGKPLFCHQRDAHDRFVEILQAYRPQLGPIVVHCFTDSRQALIDCLDLDCHIGITGWICDERRGRELQEIVKLIPDDRLMVETDAPYLLPRDLSPRPLSKTNEPCHLPHIVAAIARCREQPIDAVAQLTRHNSQQFFNI